jgi:hypothetical protein
MFHNPTLSLIQDGVNKATVNTTVKPLPKNTFAFYLLTFNFRAAVLASFALLLALAAAPKTTATSLTKQLMLAQASSPSALPDVPQGTQLTLKSSAVVAFLGLTNQAVAQQPPAPEAKVSPEAGTAPGKSGGGASWLWWLLLIPLLGGLLWWLLGKKRPSEEEAGTSIEAVAPPVAAAVPTAQSRIVLVPRDCRNAEVYWEIPDAAKAALQQQGGQQLILRIHEVTDIDMDEEGSHSVQEYECSESDRDRHVPIPIDDRDYVAELGYLSADNRWLRLARSLHARVPACPAPETLDSSDTDDSDLDFDFLDLFDTSETSEVPDLFNIPETAETSETPKLPDLFDSLETLRETGQSAIESTTSLTTGAFDAAQSLFSDFDTQPQDEERSRILLIPQDSQSADAYWEIHPEDIDALKRQGGETFALRIYDVTDIDIDTESAPNVWQYDCEENQQERHVHLPIANRDYLAELGYLTPEGRWLKLVRSLPTRVPTN